MYTKIYNPLDNKYYSIYSKKGQFIIKKYVSQIGGVKNKCKKYGKKKDPKCDDQAECNWVKTKGCLENSSRTITVKKPKKNCKKYGKKKDPKCGDQVECNWVKTKGCRDKLKANSSKKIIKVKKKAIIRKSPKKQPVMIGRDDVGRRVLHDKVAMLRVGWFRNKMKRPITGEILDKFLASSSYHKIIMSNLRELMDDEIILGRRSRVATLPYMNPSICNSFKKTKDPKCDDQELCEWGDKGKWQGVGCKISKEKLAKRNETLPWYEGWRDDTTDVLTKAYNRSYYTSMDEDIIPPWQKNYNAARWKRNKGYDVWNWGHLLYNNKISGVSVEFKSGKKSSINTHKKLYKDLESYVRSSGQNYYYNKTDLVEELKTRVKDGLSNSGFDEINYEPIPFRFAKTEKGKPFASASNPDHLDAWIKYKQASNPKGPVYLIAWGSRKALPIKEEYTQ